MNSILVEALVTMSVVPFKRKTGQTVPSLIKNVMRSATVTMVTQGTVRAIVYLSTNVVSTYIIVPIELAFPIDLVLIDPQSVGKRTHDLTDTVNAKKRWRTIYWRVNKYLK
jgi:hypothetical protein